MGFMRPDAKLLTNWQLVRNDAISHFSVEASDGIVLGSIVNVVE